MAGLPTRTRVIVIGAGVVGLTCAVRLAEAGYDVHVLARDLPLETTSAVAAAVWYPYRALPQDRVTAWSARAYAEFARLAEVEPGAGVRMRTGRELTRAEIPQPWWAEAVPDLRPVSRPPSGYAGGWEFEAPVVDMSVYLPWLVTRLERLGGTLTRHALSALPNAAQVVINCAGLAARRLADDRTLTPVRGQICQVEQIGLSEWWVDDSEPSRPVYVVPRLHDIVVGGTAEEGDWDTRPREETARAILTVAERLVPALAGARVLRHRVGLRPARPSVRLEAEDTGGGRVVVHCYGHGGAGVTMSWGCADDVIALVQERVPA
ncbi:FAD-dependent oxidoreductase [Actinopolymorpha alba]|uniref:FAD-dependent oxidoreductase n=1 Tax=Actinopolymorpha alba TaxID=533267 RepID=UPI00037E8956|nr:FAD-dependent oxidoreductase [Actinopolymorpha alba]